MTLTQNEITLEEDAQEGKYLEFIVDEEAYVISIRSVTEIIGMQMINTFPEAPEYIKGIINLRGRIIPVIDMHCFLNKRKIDYTDRTCIVVAETEVLSAGLIVDRVIEVLGIDEKDIVPPPEINKAGGRGYFSGIAKVNGEVKLLLDCDKLFSEEEARTFEEIEL